MEGHQGGCLTAAVLMTSRVCDTISVLYKNTGYLAGPPYSNRHPGN